MRSLILAGAMATTVVLPLAAFAAPVTINQLPPRNGGLLDVGSFGAGSGALPIANSGYGHGVSPDVYWTAGPEGARSYVVLMEDDAPAGGPLLLWALFNLPDTVTNVPEDTAWDADPPGLKFGANSAGGVDYLPPKPAAGAAHRYHLEVFALDTVLPLAEGAPRADLVKAMGGHVIASGETIATFKAP